MAATANAVAQSLQRAARTRWFDGIRAKCLGYSIDRKSTRLNSSHDQISYAVFCLKKKKKNRRTLITLPEKKMSPKNRLGHDMIPAPRSHVAKQRPHPATDVETTQHNID